MNTKNDKIPNLFKVETSLGTLESDVMNVIWKEKKVYVREVAEILRFKRPIAYTTVMTVMDKLFKKRFLARKKIGKAYQYRPVAPRDIFANKALSLVLHNLVTNHGKVKVLLSATRLSLPNFLLFSFSFGLSSKVAPYKKPAWYGLTFTVFSAFFLFSFWELLKNIGFFGTISYLRLSLTEPALVSNHLNLVIPAILESLPIVNLSATLIFLVFLALSAKKLVKLLDLKTTIFPKLGGAV